MASLTKEDGLKLLKDGQFTDFKIVCDDHTFNVHKAVVSPKSPFWNTCVNEDFEESKKGTVTMMEVRREVVGLALIYIYAGEPDILSLVDVWPALNKHIGHYGDIDTITMSLSLELYRFSDRLMMPELRQKTAKIIIDSVEVIGVAAAREHEIVRVTRYAAVMDMIYGTTEKDGRLVRLPVANHCLHWWGAILDMDSVIDVMNKHEPTLWAVFGESPGDVDATTKELRGENRVPRSPRDVEEIREATLATRTSFPVKHQIEARPWHSVESMEVILTTSVHSRAQALSPLSLIHSQ